MDADNNDEMKMEIGDQPTQQEQEEPITDDEKAMEEGKPSQTDTEVKDDPTFFTDKVEEENEPSRPSSSGDKQSEGDIGLPPEDDTEGMTTPPSPENNRPHNPWARKKPIVRKTRPMLRPISKQKKPKSSNKSEKPDNEKIKAKKKGKTKPTQSSETTAEEIEEKPTTEVTQFSFPQYKILSGATVAPVKVRPHKVVIHRRIEEEDEPRHWAEGLFQSTTMSLKLRLLRLLLVWLFFRVLNKQTGWLSDKLGLGLEEPMGPPPPRPTQPGERYVKVFHESSPHPIHVRVRPPPGMGPQPYS